MPALRDVTTLQGFYKDPVPAATIKVHFGCRRNMRQICYRPMSGYFYYFKIWAGQALA